MIALCPDCHSNRTRGAERAVLTMHLRKVAIALYTAWAAAPAGRGAVVRSWAEENLPERAR